MWCGAVWYLHAPLRVDRVRRFEPRALVLVAIGAHARQGVIILGVVVGMVVVVGLIRNGYWYGCVDSSA